MKSKILISISFSLFLSCGYISELKYKDEIVSEAYVNNPNGLVLYKTKGDLKSKEVVLKSEEKFYFLEKANDEVGESWRKVLYTGKELFAFVDKQYRSDILEFHKLSSEESQYGVLESDEILSETPFSNSKDLEKIPASSIVEILASEEYSSYISSIKVKTQHNNIGFIITEGIAKYKTKNLAEQVIVSNFFEIECYFLITVQEPVFLDKESMLLIDKDKYMKLRKKGNLFFVNYYIKFDGTQYYSYRMRHPSDKFSGEPSILIPQFNGKLLTEKEFTEFTIENTNYKGNKKVIQQIRNVSGDGLNFLNFHLTRLSTNYTNAVYYLATIKDGLDGANISYILRYYTNKFSLLNIEKGVGINEVKTIDIDKDGILEIFSLGKERHDSYYQLFGMKDGNYQLIADFTTDAVIKNDIIYVQERFTEFLASRDSYGQRKSISHPKGTKLKYQKGKLIKIK